MGVGRLLGEPGSFRQREAERRAILAERTPQRATLGTASTVPGQLAIRKPEPAALDTGFIGPHNDVCLSDINVADQRQHVNDIDGEPVDTTKQNAHDDVCSEGLRASTPAPSTRPPGCWGSGAVRPMPPPATARFQRCVSHRLLVPTAKLLGLLGVQTEQGGES